jgi:FdhD protein
MNPPVRNIELTQVTEWNDGAVHFLEDSLAIEEPLEIRVNGAPLTVTMRTPGHDVELAAGFLFTEGIIESREQIAVIRAAVADSMEKSNIVEAQLKDCDFEPKDLHRNFVATASCGVCGRSSIEAVRRRGLHVLNGSFHIAPEVLSTLPEALRTKQAVFDRTGGLHAAALFDAEGTLIAIREDIGRHNAVDKVVGWALLEGRVPLHSCVLMVSGRGGFEIVQKALAVGIPVIASVSAPSSLAVKLARELNGTLIGFVRGRRFVVYAGGFRCVPDVSQIACTSAVHP